MLLLSREVVRLVLEIISEGAQLLDLLDVLNFLPLLSEVGEDLVLQAGSLHVLLHPIPRLLRVDECGEDLDQRVESGEGGDLLAAETVFGVVEHAPICEGDSLMDLIEYARLLVVVHLL